MTITEVVVMAGARAVGKHSGTIKRSLNGATFLTLEHAAHMALVIIVAALVACGAMQLLQVWLGATMPWLSALALFSGSILPTTQQAMSSMCLVAALVVLTPLMLVLNMRIRAEWVKRPGYTARVAYKAPIYTALAAAAVALVGSLIAMLSIVFNSVALIGLPGIDFGALYMSQFVPALLVFVVFMAVKWYLFMLAKGKDTSRQFDAMLATVAFIFAVALFTTSVTTLRQPNTQITPTNPYYDTYTNPRSLSPFKY